VGSRPQARLAVQPPPGSARPGDRRLGDARQDVQGPTDELLTWQTARFLELEDHRDDYTVYVHPEQVVEIAFDGVQRSPRYPGGVALRFARVLRYREDKTAMEADTINAVTALAPPTD
jgi:DNA ligase-1